MEADEWASLAVTISLTWPGSRWSEANAAAYYLALQMLDGGHVALALSRLVETNRHVPSIAEIIEHARLVKREAEHGLVALPAGRDWITYREWILSGTGDYRNGRGEMIAPSEALQIGLRNGIAQGRFGRDEVERADVLWREIHHG